MSNGAIALIIIIVAFFVFGLSGGKESKLRGSTYWIALFIVGFVLVVVWSAHGSIIPGGH